MTPRNALQEPKARFEPWFVLAVGLLTTGVLWGGIVRAVENRHKGEFRVEVEGLANEIDNAVAHQVSLLHGVSGGVAIRPDLDRKGFATLYENLTRGERGNIPAAVGFTVRRPWERRGELAQDAARRGAAGFRFHPAAPTRAEAHAVVLVEPLTESNVAVLGYDMHSDPTLADAMDSALVQGNVVMTPRVVSEQDGAGMAPSFLLYTPVFQNTSSGDRGEMYGFAYSVIRIEALFEGLRRHLAAKHIGLRLWSGPRRTDGAFFAADADAPARYRLRRTVPLDFVHRRFEAEFSMREGFGGPAAIQPWVVPIGVLVSLMLFMLTRNLLRAHEDAERRGAEQGLLSEVGRLTAGSSDADDVLMDITQAMARILGGVVRVDLVEADGSLRAVSTRTTNVDALAEIERDRPRLEGDPYLRAAMQTGLTQRGEGYTARDEAHRIRLEKLNIGHVVVVPMMARGRAIGAMTLTRPKGRPALPDDAVGLTEALAGRIALAVDNARLLRVQKQEIAERTAAEAEVRRLNDGLEEIVAERTRDLEASNHELESFCYSVSHDLRTPLRSLDGFGRALREDYGDRLDEQGLDYIERIRASTKRMDELITALLTLSRLTRREIVPVDVDVTAAVKELVHDLDPGERYSFRVGEGLRAEADPRMLAIVFENLLGNAIKFSAHTEKPMIEVGRADDGAIFVRDNGAGFDMQYAAKLFQPFERLHSVREFPGHGIGLATVERILKRHGGEVRAEGKPGAGATFYVRFP